MPMVRAIVDCFVDNTYRKANEQFEYKGPKNENLEPVKRAKDAAEAEPEQVNE